MKSHSMLFHNHLNYIIYLDIHQLFDFDQYALDSRVLHEEALGPGAQGVEDLECSVQPT
jgi:hypothetical protein